MEFIVGFILVAAFLVGIHGWFSDKSTRIKENQYNRELRKQINEEKRKHDQTVQDKAYELKTRAEYLSQRDQAFANGYLAGRSWLAKFIADADKALDEAIAYRLRTKKRPAMRAAEEVSAARAEKRHYKEKVKFLEYQLLSYKEYFPLLEEYQEVILDESIPLSVHRDNVDALESSDPVLKFVDKAEYDQLSTVARNQLALERYIARSHSQATIGRFYERYLGYLHERDGWEVQYIGIFKGLEDLGRDLICKKGNEVRVIQAKCWSAEKLIHEKHVFQLFGTTQLFLMDEINTDLFAPNVEPFFITTTQLSEVARKAAQWLKISVKEEYALIKNYPMIKCNINPRTEDKIYRLPMDQQYDKVKIKPETGECYVQTTAEAEELGFRRAFRYRGERQQS